MSFVSGIGEYDQLGTRDGVRRRSGYTTTETYLKAGTRTPSMDGSLLLGRSLIIIDIARPTLSARSGFRRHWDG